MGEFFTEMFAHVIAIFVDFPLVPNFDTAIM